MIFFMCDNNVLVYIIEMALFSKEHTCCSMLTVLEFNAKLYSILICFVLWGHFCYQISCIFVKMNVEIRKVPTYHVQNRFNERLADRVAGETPVQSRVT